METTSRKETHVGIQQRGGLKKVCSWLGRTRLIAAKYNVYIFKSPKPWANAVVWATNLPKVGGCESGTEPHTMLEHCFASLEAGSRD